MIYVVAFSITCIVCMGFAFFFIRKMRMISTDTLGIIILLMFLWTAVSLAECSVNNWSFLRYSNMVGYIAYTCLPLLWICMLLEFITHRPYRRSMPMRICYLASMSFVLLSVYNPNQLFYSEIIEKTVDGRQILEYRYGVLFYVYVGYLYTAFAIVLLWSVYKCYTNCRQMKLMGYMLLAILVPIGVNVIYLVRITAYDLTALGFNFSVLMFWLLYRNGFFMEMPPSSKKTLDHLPDGLVIRNPRGEVVEMNPAAVKMLGLENSGDRFSDATAIFAQWDGEEVPEYANGDDVIFTHVEKEERHYQILTRRVEGEKPGMHYRVSTLMDETEYYQVSQRILYIESHDVQTDLANREAFLYMLQERMEKNEEKVLVFCFSTGQYRISQEIYGTAYASDLLREVAMRIRRYTHKDAVISRFDGDIFYLYLPVDECDYRGVMESLYTQLEMVFAEPVAVNGSKVFISLFVGAVCYPEHGEDVEDLTDYARIAMQEQSVTGVSGLCVYYPELSSQTKRRRSMQKQLSSALENKELYLVYQPQVNIAESRVYSAEALLRWRNPELGNVPPSEFIPVAEQTGLINSIGRFALESAVAQGKKWHLEGQDNLRISVNASVCQLREGDFADFVGSVLDREGFPPHCLEIEVTESIALSMEDVVNTQIIKLHNMGIRLAIDDFGMGHASLSYLKNFHFDTLKVDRILAYDIDSNAVSEATVRSIQTLCQALSVELLIEFIERREQIEVLKRLKCWRVQGYYFSKPLTSKEFLVFLRNFTALMKTSVS